MLKNIRKLQGTKELEKSTQRNILGGLRAAARCKSQSDCSIDQICQNGRCFNCFDPRTGYWFC
ncbi:hypothetical protein KORDIASMS9_04265 [Kordia sp. SMS9]|uniref:hypothetical protein n=1 Tax=Kordia sp. SMS9 TaxID=2282170 RepID=UPI000E0DB8C2|nr:hypothetical protein [Kordia sp. SMS9]AXG72004.1 hypothetical protein KORDIASMS9_04265 [Kordia sp. SMS9]